MAPQAIPPKLYYAVAEVAEIVGVKAHVLRYWEAEFGFLDPLPKGEERLYTRRDLERALDIKRLLDGGRHSVTAAKRKLREEWAKAREAEVPREEGDKAADPREERRRLLRRLHGEAEDLVRILKRR